jgi:DHA2 family multidrug resistance protein-like MFS transporter
VIGSVVFSLGVAPGLTLATEMIVGSAPPERAGAASGISETSGEFGGALGIAVLGSIGTAVYRSEVADAFPARIPPEAAETARDTLGGAVVAAEQLPGPLGAGLLDAAREAFTQGLQLTAVTSAAIVLGMAILAVILLRNVSAGAEREPRPDTEPEGQSGHREGARSAAAAAEKSRV